jgi:hypothetical protein
MEVLKKGSFLRGFLVLDRGLILSFGSLFGLLILFYKMIFPDMPFASEKYHELILFTIGQFGLTVFLYWLTSTNYYYYELFHDKIVVRNFLTPFAKELPLSTLQYVSLFGDLSAWWSSNGVEFIYQYNDSRKNFQFISHNYSKNDWIRFIEELKKLNIDVQDPHKRFFKYIPTSN